MGAHNKNHGQGGAGRNVAAPKVAQPTQSTYDGPNESPSRGRAASTTGGSVRPSSRPGSQTRTASRTRQDPAQAPPVAGVAPVLVRNVDFGGQAYDLYSTVSHNSSRGTVEHPMPTCITTLRSFFTSTRDFVSCEGLHNERVAFQQFCERVALLSFIGLCYFPKSNVFPSPSHIESQFVLSMHAFIVTLLHRLL